MITPTGWTGWTLILLTVRGDVMKAVLLSVLLVIVGIGLFALKIGVIFGVLYLLASCVGLV